MLFSKRTDCKGIAGQISHGSVLHELDKLTDIDWFDRARRRNKERTPIAANKHDVVCSLLPLFDSLRASNGFEVFNPPIARVSAHFTQKFVSLAHVDDKYFVIPILHRFQTKSLYDNKIFF